MGIILNGLVEKGFDDSFTRIPQRTADGAGVLDYIFGAPQVLQFLLSLGVLDFVPDLSDHAPVALDVDMNSVPAEGNPSSSNFSEAKLEMIIPPDDEALFKEVDDELSNSEEYRSITDRLDNLLRGRSSTSDIGNHVNSLIERTTRMLFETFRSRGLVRRRPNRAQSQKTGGSRSGAPEPLRILRAHAREAAKTFKRLARSGAPETHIQAAKHQLNRATSKCRSASAAVRRRMCLSWTGLWDKLRHTAPRKLWATYRAFTSEPSPPVLVSPDDQWRHWASQGEVHEELWTDTRNSEAMDFVNYLRSCPMSGPLLPETSMAEVKSAADRLRCGRAAGYDGLSTDSWCKMHSVLLLMSKLFSLVLRSGVYPTSWGISLIASLLKPGKPATSAASLRGIRLLSRIAAWFGQAVDQRARAIWRAGPEQFGFQIGVGCAEAIFVLLTLIHSRVHEGRRLYVLFVDLRTAFPSLNRAILIRRMFECGLGLGYCKLALAAFDGTVSIVRVGRLLGSPFLEKLCVREGGVESPHQFNMYIGEFRERLEANNPRLCRLLHLTIAVLLYADDAALPPDSFVDLEVSVKIFVDFCNEMQLYISTSQTVLMVFHPDGDVQVVYCGDTVVVEGNELDLRIYGVRIKAACEFKYLGMMLQPSGSASAHVEARLSAFDRASNMLVSRLTKIPAFSHSFLIYLWTTLVLPTALYGLEVLTLSEADVQKFNMIEIKTLRRLLNVGCRAPSDVIHCMVKQAFEHVQTHRAAMFLLKLANSPVRSWQHAALVHHVTCASRWYTRALDIIRIAYPALRLQVIDCAYGLCLHSPGVWTDEGSWHSLTSHAFPLQENGRRYRLDPPWCQDDQLEKSARRHISQLSSWVSTSIQRRLDSALWRHICDANNNNNSSELKLIQCCILAPGVPLHCLFGLGQGAIK